VDVFTAHPACGVIAGRILPRFVSEPPEWALKCQANFNGWSLFSEGTYPKLRLREIQEVPSAAGPMMAIRSEAYHKVSGFPPDTIGVETNRGEKLFSKLYIGPGDYGLCVKIRKAGWKIYYSPNISVYHVIPPVRFTVSFWRSRMIGEGYYVAISQRGFWNMGKVRSFLRRKRYEFLHSLYEKKLCSKLAALNGDGSNKKHEGMYPEELWVRYYKAYLDMDAVLRKYPDLWKFLWEIGNQGVNTDNYDHVMANLPQEYKRLVDDTYVYDSTQLDGISSYNKQIRNGESIQDSQGRNS
jgi:hypothetical protein